MKRILSVIILLLLLGSCNQKRKTPEGILSEDQMVSVLLDIQLTEGMVSAIPVPYDSSNVLYPLMEKDVFEKHGVTDSVFTRSIKFYLEDVVTMERIYARVIDSLVVKENSPGLEERM